MLNNTRMMLAAIAYLAAMIPANAETITLPPLMTGNFNITNVDMNNDGNADIVYTSTYNTNIGILLSNGDGTFTNTSIPGDYRSYNIEVIDLNKDGLLDIVTTNISYNYVNVFWNTGTPNYTKNTYAVGNMPTSLAVADLNNDGYPEIMASNAVSRSISILTNTSSTTIKRFTTGPVLDGAVNDFTTSDINKDGFMDIVSVQGGVMTIWTNNGNLTFMNNVVTLSYSPAVRIDNFGDNFAVVYTNVGANVSKIDVMNYTGEVFDTYVSPALIMFNNVFDINNDNLLDLVVTNSDNTIDVVENSVNGFGTGTQYAIEGVTIPGSTTVVDFDNDGSYEVITTNTDTPLFGVVRPTFVVAAPEPVIVPETIVPEEVVVPEPVIVPEVVNPVVIVPPTVETPVVTVTNVVPVVEVPKVIQPVVTTPKCKKDNKHDDDDKVKKSHDNDKKDKKCHDKDHDDNGSKNNNDSKDRDGHKNHH